jgi:hypothetical protein
MLCVYALAVLTQQGSSSVSEDDLAKLAEEMSSMVKAALPIRKVRPATTYLVPPSLRYLCARLHTANVL